jgi:hypothetical protein
MPLLPSGRYWCIHDSPINKLLKSLRINGLRVPELISIDSIAQLQRRRMASSMVSPSS